MKERPILMTPENAQKVHDGTKTQTRRIVKVPVWVSEEDMLKLVVQRLATGLAYYKDGQPVKRLTCPYGVCGDRLWIREAHQFDPPDDGTWGYTSFFGCNGSPLEDIPERFRNSKHCLYRGNWAGSPLIWRPSIHMPRWACRTVVEITEIRVERVQDISEEDAKAEGCKSADYATGREVILDPSLGSYRLAFRDLWDSINGKGAWERNEWVWVIGMKKVQP